ncbi:unnamed protein product [Trichogramma brassicae]|uniref:Uncharacterized protein n=1 Tax=Trichogramma brassicae TaxID=86971 RepID=A0A6H5HZR2_9HYME|nr:unnamed protein product [Trichogramma brassicae]
MTSSEKFDIYGGNGGAEGQYDFDSEIKNYKKIISNLEKLKSMREMVIRAMKGDRLDFRDDLSDELHLLIDNWEGQYPNFRKMLRPKEMDWLLTKCVRNEDVISFVIKSGYRDVPELDEEGKPLLNRCTPLLYAANCMFIKNSVCKLFEIYDRFDVNYIDESGCTHFHVACQFGFDDIVQKFLELGQDPNILAPKSVARQKGEDEEDEEEELVRPPLHLALEGDHRQVVELLLKNGADPNLATADGTTALHTLCETRNYDAAVWFFEVNKELGQPVLVDARDKLGRTPLQWAVARFSPEFVDVLLVNGADPSNFVFPDDSYFGKELLIPNILKLRLASGALFIVERLENEGYELNRSDALTIMKLFAKCGWFEYSMDLVQDLRSDEEFMNKAKEMKIKDNDPNLSLHDLIMLRPDEAAKRITCADVWKLKCYKFFRLSSFEETHKKVCVMHLCETISRRFCRRWALDSVLELTRHKLPTLCMRQMMSDEKFDVYGGNCSAECQCDFDFEIVNHKKIISNLEKLERMREMVIRAMKGDRLDLRDLSDELHLLINNWEGQYPNFRKIFRPKEMDWLLKKYAYKEVEDVINFVIKSGYKDEPELDEDGKPLLNRSTPLHYANYVLGKSRVRKFFEIYDRFDINYINEDGLTHLHVACQFGFDDIVQNFLEHGQNPNILPPKPAVDYEGDPVIPPLHMALVWCHKEVVELLLKNGADPNLATAEGLTPLHAIVSSVNSAEMADLFFKICDDKNLTVLVNTQNARGDTPLHAALKDGASYMTELLLRRGADPSLVNEKGSTPLHTLCKDSYDEHELAETFFMVNDEIRQTVPIDARDKKGNTPLHLALSRGHKAMIELLLRKDANPNLVNEEGSTPLHVICQRKYDDDLMKLFFEIIGDVQKTVQVDAVDKSGHTPLQWAVANLLLDTIDVLLDHGADLSSFTFPTVGHFDEEFNWFYNFWTSVKLEFASDTMSVVEHLDKKGYELDLSGAITIMNAFDKHEFLRRPVILDESWYEEFMKKAKEMMVKPSLSIYDMIMLRPELASEKLITFTEVYDFAESKEYYEFSQTYHDECDPYLCEIPTRRFFKGWALTCFLELINYKLPILCCDKIIEKLHNEDLWRVCLAATDENS